MATIKVLFSGAPEGSVAPLLKKLDTVNKKSGPFDALFCVGQFFGAGADDADPDAALVDFVTGTAPVAVQTCFVGGYGQGSAALLDALPASDSKLRHLGRSGVTRVGSLTVAFLDGTYNAAAFFAPAGAAPGSGRHYTQLDVVKLKAALNELEGEVDVLLTCEWPREVTRGVPVGLLPEGFRPTPNTGSVVCAEIAALARPRYHFAGGEDVFFARPPFVSRDQGAGVRVTRFIGMPPTGNTTKQKSLHALSLLPASLMDPEALSLLPEGTTPSPYEAAAAAALAAKSGGKRPGMDGDQELPEGQDWRWQAGKKPRRDPSAPVVPIPGRAGVVRDAAATVAVKNLAFDATEADVVGFFAQVGEVVNVVRGLTNDGRLVAWTVVQLADKEAAGRALQLNGTLLQGRTLTIEPAHAPRGAPPPVAPESFAGKAVEGCWFCLGSASVDIGLVASVGEDSYLAVDKGPISDTHVLVVPIDHCPSTTLLSPQCHAEVERYMAALRECYASLGKQLVAFERHLALRKQGGNHCHINCIAVDAAGAARSAEAFKTAASAAGFEMVSLPSTSSSGEEDRGALQAAVGNAGEYFLAVLPDGSRLVKCIARGERWPMNLGREVLADLAGARERADWKACAPASPAEEEERCATFKKLFKPFDIMGGGD